MTEEERTRAEDLCRRCYAMGYTPNKEEARFIEKMVAAHLDEYEEIHKRVKYQEDKKIPLLCT